MNWGTRRVSAWDYDALDRVCWSDDQFQKEDGWLFFLDIEKDVVLSSLGRSSPHCATGGLTKVTKLGEAGSEIALKVLLNLKRNL